MDFTSGRAGRSGGHGRGSVEPYRLVDCVRLGVIWGGLCSDLEVAARVAGLGRDWRGLGASWRGHRDRLDGFHVPGHGSFWRALEGVG